MGESWQGSDTSEMGGQGKCWLGAVALGGKCEVVEDIEVHRKKKSQLVSF